LFGTSSDLPRVRNSLVVSLIMVARLFHWVERSRYAEFMSGEVVVGIVADL